MSKVLRLLLASCFLIGGLSVTRLTLAGGIKDVLFQHLEAVAEYLYGESDTESLQYRNPQFVPAAMGFQLAIQSEVQIYDSKLKAFRWITCATQFLEKTSGRYSPASTSCEK